MLIASVAETSDPRVALTADSIKRFKALGADIAVEKGAGLSAGIPDSLYDSAGAKLLSREDIFSKADMLVQVRRLSSDDAAKMKKDALLLALMDPYGNEKELDAFAKAQVKAFAMELMPRITRAQTMDVLSSQANLAGYRAVLDAAHEFGRALPMMMTAAGTVPAARIFVMGAGVAGLQAIATARRLGAVVTATDVRPAAKEQVESLGGKFVAVEDEEFKQAETAAGYAKPMSEAYQTKQAELVAAHIAKQDIVITTALIPGRPAPKLVSADMLKAMKPGSVIVDLALERGGNVAGAKADEIVDQNGVKIIGYVNVAGRLAETASQLYARNLYAFAETLIDKGTKKIDIKTDDELVKATLLTSDGKIVHPQFMKKEVAA
ncbi:MAG: Re/Si-specific NAD(P)(+) transhydrogenase subunit alpha [Pseudomonadota bacterium]